MASNFVVSDDEIESFFYDIVNDIKSTMGYDHPINVYVSSSNVFNASATQDGNIIINAGTIDNVDNVQEIIAVVAHEVAHIAGYHISTYLAASSDFARAGLVTVLIGGLVTAVSGDPTALMAGALGGNSISERLSLSKIRQKENTADTKAAEAIKKLGWPVFDGFISIHKKFDERSVIFNSYEMTHPLSTDRITKFRMYYEEFKSKDVKQSARDAIEKYRKRFTRVKVKLSAILKNPDDVIAIMSLTDDMDSLYAKAIALYKKKRFSDAIGVIGKIRGMDSDSQDLAYLAEIEAMSLIGLEKYGEAAGVAFENLRKNSKKVYRDLAIIFAESVFLGNINGDLKKNAIKFLKRASIRFPREGAIMKMLGKLYYASKEYDYASLYAAEEAVIGHDERVAMIHAKKAALSKNKIIRKRASDIVSALS